MTPKEKAVELADIYFEIVKDIDWRKTNSPPMFMAHVKKCALAAVDEILKYSKYILHWMPCNNPEWDVTILMEKDEPKSFVKRKVIRKLDNGEEIEWTCFWDNGWFSAVGIKIPNVISWERLPILDADGCLILKPIK